MKGKNKKAERGMKKAKENRGAEMCRICQENGKRTAELVKNNYGNKTVRFIDL